MIQLQISFSEYLLEKIMSNISDEYKTKMIGIGAFLKSERKSQQISISELSRMIGCIDRKTIAALEKGNNVKILTLLLVAEGLGINPFAE